MVACTLVDVKRNGGYNYAYFGDAICQYLKKERQMVKLSKFNYIIDDKNELRLYNSLHGTDSLLIVNENNKERVLDYLSDPKESKLDIAIIKKLLVNGYIVPEEEDEDISVRLRANDVINNNCLTLRLMPTEDCNFRCEYCYEEHKKGKMSDTVQKSVVRFVAKNISKYNQLRVCWFGGEPLCALDVIETLSYSFKQICKVAKKRYSASMTTNGYNLSLTVLKKLLDINVYDYQITIDGLKSIHDKYRHLVGGGGTFDRIVGNIKEMQKLRKNNYRVVIRTNFTKESEMELSDYLSFCEELFGTDKRFSLDVHLVGNWGGDSVEKINNHLLNNSSYDILMSEIVRIHPHIRFDSLLNDLEAYQFKCYAALRNSIVIGSDGCLYKCTEDFEMPTNRLGNLLDDGSMDIDYNKFAKWVDWTYKVECGECGQCSYMGCCLGSPCPKVKIRNEHGNFCPRNKKSIENVVRLLDRDLFETI